MTPQQVNEREELANLLRPETTEAWAEDLRDLALNDADIVLGSQWLREHDSRLLSGVADELADYGLALITENDEIGHALVAAVFNRAEQVVRQAAERRLQGSWF